MSTKKSAFSNIDNSIIIKSQGIITSEILEENKKNEDNYRKIILVLSVLVIVLIIISIFFTCNMISIDFLPAKYSSIVRNNFDGFFNFLKGTGVSNGINITFFRIIIIALVGSALSLSGAVFQGVFRNPVASPETVGAQSGALIAGMAYIFLFMQDNNAVQIYSYNRYLDITSYMGILEEYTRQIVSIAGAFILVTLIMFIAKIVGRGKITVTTLLLLGTVVNTFIQSLISLIRFYMIRLDETDSRISLIQTFMMGSFNNVYSFEHLLFIGIPIVICILILLLKRVKINVLIFGEEEANVMGIKTGSFRLVLIIIASALSAITISFCGQIGFIGMIVPHISRMLCGSDYKKLIPVSALCGSVLLLIIYDLAVTFSAAIYINMVSSLICGTIFLVIMIKDRRKRNAEWT